MRSENSKLMKRKTMWTRGEIGRGICAAGGITFGTKLGESEGAFEGKSLEEVVPS